MPASIKSFARIGFNQQENAKIPAIVQFEVDVVVKVTCRLTGLRIIRAICSGEKNPEKLAELRHHNCHTSKADMARALQSNGREDLGFSEKYMIFLTMTKTYFTRFLFL